MIIIISFMSIFYDCYDFVLVLIMTTVKKGDPKVKVQQLAR